MCKDPNKVSTFISGKKTTKKHLQKKEFNKWKKAKSTYCTRRSHQAQCHFCLRKHEIQIWSFMINSFFFLCSFTWGDRFQNEQMDAAGHKDKICYPLLTSWLRIFYIPVICRMQTVNRWHIRCSQLKPTSVEYILNVTGILCFDWYGCPK